jgi:formate dehydrogenase major subunit
MFRLPVADASQPFSPQTADKASRLRGAAVTAGVCPYCAVGCGQLIYTKGGTLVNVEGDPRSPINEGTLCPKGANAFQLAVNPHRVTRVLYRAPHAADWEVKPLAWAVDAIARRVKDARDRELAADGRVVKSVGTLGGATLDIEENYLMKKLFTGGLGVLPVENQARI